FSIQVSPWAGGSWGRSGGERVRGAGPPGREGTWGQRAEGNRWRGTSPGRGSNGVTDFVGDIDKLALGEFSVRTLLIIDVLPHLQHDLVGARGGIGVFITRFRPGGRGGDHLSVAADFPLQAQAPVVGHLAPDDPA